MKDELNPEVLKQVEAIAFALITQQEKEGRSAGALEMAKVIMARSMIDAACWLRETLADSPKDRYNLALVLDEQAILLAQSEEIK